MTTVQGVTMSTWVPVITAGSLDAFVIGASVSGAFFIAILISWRLYRREPADSEPETVAVGLDMFQDDAAGGDSVAVGPDRLGDEAARRGTWAPEPPDPGPWLTGPQEPVSGKRQARAGSHRAAHALGDPTMADGMPKPPGARRPPRHAAPSPRLSGKKNGVSAARSLADSNRG
jgi:hypothetical protein